MSETGNGRKNWTRVVAAVGLVFLAVAGGIVLANANKVINKTEKKDEETPLISIGFSQVGAESEWRTGNSISIKTTFSQKRGYDLIFKDAQQQQEQQIKAIRGFIQQDVNYIVLAPVVETGWDTVLKEAKKAKIPVIIADRQVKVKDDSLYTTWVGADFYQEGQKACSWMEQYAERNKKKTLNIVHIMGTEGATAQIGRTKALEEAAKKNGWNILEQQTGAFTQAKSHEVMEEYLKKYKDIDMVYCENDSEALGAINAIEQAGKKVGTDGIQIISFDATREGLAEVQNGKIAVDVECNPDFGKKIEKIIKQLEYKRDVNKEYYIGDKIYTQNKSISTIEIEKAKWSVTVVTDKIVRRLRNATSRINTAFFVTYKQITPHRIWYNRVD